MGQIYAAWLVMDHCSLFLKMLFVMLVLLMTVLKWIVSLTCVAMVVLALFLKHHVSVSPLILTFFANLVYVLNVR